MRGIFPNKETLIIDLPAGKPVNVPDYVAKYFIKNRPQRYRYANEPAPVETENIPQETNEIKFNPVEFLQNNYLRIEEALQPLKRKELLTVGKQLGLKGIFNQKDNRIIERIVVDIKTKEKQQEELDKHKEAGK